MIDLRSDTVTQPDEAMRTVMASAPVGDDVMGEDPSVNRLEAAAAALTGKEGALFLPTGTMANLVAFLSQTRPGDTVILCSDAHPYRFEAGNLARFGGLLTKTLAGSLGKLGSADVAANIIQTDDPHISPTTMVSIENTTNLGSGAFYTVDEVTAMGQLCHERGLRLHCDGARFFNAVVAQQVEAAQLAAPCDTVSFCLSKGLGAPAGSILAGDRATIHAARRLRKQLGGGMRQAGILAAAGLYALEHHVATLAEDHRRAGEFRKYLEGLGISFLYPSPTNILFMASERAQEDVASLRESGILALPVGSAAIRVVFHRDISDGDASAAAEGFARVLRR